ncbi:endonuclease/exonuclease/phosphatase family protein [Jannaschia sp. M317]|uniref:endonuclease/exonuclease/phosphatase family protein n=1 Tax=Jannaschia sp. M317 TaxID=2867011 RepID=UPI0021A78C08|nr:endonuclease/exonuclease/phosphatase family protein [Jannaschia sp. M317]
MCAAPVAAETIRIATYHAELSRKGPAVLLRDLTAGKDAQVDAVLTVIAAAQADILLLLDVDWDFGGAAVAALVDGLGARGLAYPHQVALAPNAGVPSGFDLDGNGRLGEGRDALGYGRFTGDGGMALLSRLPLGQITDHSAVLWSEVSAAPAAVLPVGAAAVVPLASVAQWEVSVPLGDGVLTLLTLNANTPVFDGPEDRNGLRNADELAFVAGLAGAVPRPVVLGRANIDPMDGEGDRAALRRLLEHPALSDPEPTGQGGGGDHAGDPALDTVDWEGPGPLRVDYILPSRDLRVIDSGVIWPAPDDPLADVVRTASRGRLVWVDVSLP